MTERPEDRDTSRWLTGGEPLLYAGLLLAGSLWLCIGLLGLEDLSLIWTVLLALLLCFPLHRVLRMGDRSLDRAWRGLRPDTRVLLRGIAWAVVVAALVFGGALYLSGH